MRRSALLPLAVVLLAGCAADRLCRVPPGPAADAAPAGEAGYRIGCPDVLAVSFADHPDWDCLATVDVDGAVPLGPAGRPRVEGLTPDQARAAIASAAGVEPAAVGLAVAEVRATRVYLAGPENRRQRPVPYRGPERAVEFLWRVGAVQPGRSDLRDVTVVRPNVAGGGGKATFRVDVAAVVLDGDHATNVVLQPGDEVTVGETRRSSFSRLVPDWLLPAYRKLTGILPPELWPWNWW